MNLVYDCSNYDYFVFDCDGVILDSNRIKTDGFRYALRHEPHALAEKLVDYHISHGGFTRYEKFEYYFSNFARKSDEAALNRALGDFADYCQKAMANVELVEGVRAFLQAVQARGIPAYVVSGGSELEIIDIFSRINLTTYFKIIRGNPTPKVKLVEELAATGALVGRGLYFGDAALDYALASKYEMDFIFVAGVSDWHDGHSLSETEGFSVIKDFLAIAC